MYVTDNTCQGKYLPDYVHGVYYLYHIQRNKYVLYIISRKWQDYVYIQCEYKSTKQKIKHLLREENKVKENKIS